MCINRIENVLDIEKIDFMLYKFLLSIKYYTLFQYFFSKKDEAYILNYNLAQNHNNGFTNIGNNSNQRIIVVTKNLN